MLIPLLHGAILAGPSLYKFGSRLVDRARRKVMPRATTTAAVLATTVGPVLAPPPKWARYRGARPELRGAPENTVLALPGYKLFQPEDFDALFEVAESLGVPVDSLWTVIHHESGGDATALNQEPAAGLIQLTTYAKLAGYDTKDKIRAIIYQTAREQLRGVVRQHYERFAATVHGMSPGELLLFNFTPKFVGKPEPTVIASRGEPTYDKNYKGFDLDGRGTITVGDVYRAAERRVAEAGGRRVTRDGRVLAAPAGPEPPAVATVAAPATPSVAAKPALPRAAPRPAVAPAVAPAVPPPSSAVPDPLAFVSRAGVAMPAGPATAPAPGEGSSPMVGAFDRVRDLVTGQGAGGLLDRAKSAFSELTTGGGSIGPSTDPRGLLLAAAQAQGLDPVGWTWVPLPGEDLEVYVPNDAFKATLGDTPHVRIPVSYAELRELCHLLGCVPATRGIVDAIYQRATVRPKPVGLVNDESDSQRMNTVGFVLKYHAQLEQQLLAAAAAKGLAALDDSTLIEPAGKWWIVDPKLGTSKYGAHGAVNYGWFQTSVKDPIQTPGGAHNDVHCDYSQLARAVNRYARRPSTNEQVDLCDVYAAKWPDLSPFIDVFR